jgi:hypothetical protein
MPKAGTKAERAAYTKARRAKARLEGFCPNCQHRPTLPHRKHCAQCLCRAQVKEAFKRDRKRTGIASRAGISCYCDGYCTAWISEVVERFDGKCFYTGWDIELGSTAAVDHKIPVSRIGRGWSSAVVQHPDNLVWAHKAVNVMKADMTDGEFLQWLRHHLPLAIEHLNP